MPNLRILRLTLVALPCILLFNNCATFRQVEKLKTCDFRLERIEDMNIDGINVNKFHSLNDLGFINTGKILADLAKGSLSSDFRIIISVKNPNNTVASMDKFDFLVLFDDIEVLAGSSTQSVDIPANGNIEFPLSAHADISKLIQQKSISNLVDLANSMNNLAAFQKRIKIKIRPFIRIGKKLLKYPGFVDIRINE